MNEFRAGTGPSPAAVCLMADVALASMSRLPAFADVRAAHERNSRPVVRSHVKTTFGDSTFWAEGVDADSTTKHLFVASIRHRTIADIFERGVKPRRIDPATRIALTLQPIGVDLVRARIVGRGEQCSQQLFAGTNRGVGQCS